MKNKLVVWGTNATEEKVLIALELMPDSNKVMLYTFSESIADEEFVGKMMNEWRSNGEVEFPEGHTSAERELTGTLLPDDLKVERDDLINRAQTEWHFAVLSSKLHKAYQDELQELKERVAQLTSYDSTTWDSLRSFWDKVQEQARDRNLFREHADGLRDGTNALFEELKQMRAKVQDEFMGASQGLFEEFNEKLAEVEKRIQAGGNKLNAVFDELKGLQRKYRESKMSNEHRNKLWNRLDGAFKAAKEKKFGPDANEGSLVDRHERRLTGLMEAISRMENSVRRDEDELNFQRKKVNDTEGQLEAQIRNAKIKMVEERMVSKREKLNEMYQTRSTVERQIQQAKDKEDKRQKMDAAKAVAKEEIAAAIKTSTVVAETAEPEAPKAKGKKGAKVAEEAPETPKAEEQAPQQEESIFGALGAILGETLEDVSDTVMAVTSVMGGKAAKAIDEAMEKVEDYVEEMTKEKEKPSAEATEETAAPEAATAEVTEATEDATAEAEEATTPPEDSKKADDEKEEA